MAATSVHSWTVHIWRTNKQSQSKNSYRIEREMNKELRCRVLKQSDKTFELIQYLLRKQPVSEHGICCIPLQHSEIAPLRLNNMANAKESGHECEHPKTAKTCKNQPVWANSTPKNKCSTSLLRTARCSFTFFWLMRRWQRVTKCWVSRQRDMQECGL